MKDEKRMREEHSPTTAEPSLRGGSLPAAAARRTLILPCLLIALGAGWLLTELRVGPDISWVWTLGLAAVGLLAFVVGGFDKVSVVVGPFFLVASGLSYLRQTGRLDIELELPILMIVAGASVLAARSPAIPSPNWILQEPKPRRQDQRAMIDD